MKKIANYLKKAGPKYFFGFEKEFYDKNEGALGMEALFHKYDVAVVDFIKSNKYGKQYIDKLKKVMMIQSQDQAILNELERHIVKYNQNQPDEWVKVFINNEPWFLKKIDSTHLYSSNAPKEGIPIHIAELIKNKKFYEDVKDWLHGFLKITNKKYTD